MCSMLDFDFDIDVDVDIILLHYLHNQTTAPVIAGLHLSKSHRVEIYTYRRDTHNLPVSQAMQCNAKRPECVRC